MHSSQHHSDKNYKMFYMQMSMRYKSFELLFLQKLINFLFELQVKVMRRTNNM